MRELLVMTLLVFSAGCGGVHTEGGAVNSGLSGVYTIDTYLVSLENCDDGIPDVAPPPASRIVMYGYREEGSNEIGLAGNFCTSVQACRDVARAELTPLMGYAFAEDNDGGWIGFDFPGGAPYDGRPFGLVQEHMLVQTAGGIRAETRTLQARRHCVELLVLEGTFEAGL